MFLILTDAGKPVYSTSQNAKIPEFCGILATVFEFFLLDSSKLLSFSGKTHKFVFLQRNSLIFTFFTSMEEVLGRNYLMLLSDLLVFHFTNYSLKKILKDKPNYDLPEVSGIKGFIENNMGSYQSLLRIQEAIPVLRVQKGTRECLRLAFSKVDAKNICFSMLFCNGKIIMTKRQKNFYPCPPDLVLLMENITIAALQSTEDAEIWMPVCLPRYNKNGFLYLYGVFLTRKLGIACLTLDKEGFANCSQFSKEIKQKVLQLKEIESLSASIRSDPFHLGN